MRTEHYDAHSRAVFKMFESKLNPLIEQVTPDWILHHMELERRTNHRDFSEEVCIRLIIKPIGSARFADNGADLNTGHKRLNTEVKG